MDDGGGWVTVEFECKICGEEAKRSIVCGDTFNSPRCKDCRKAMVVSAVETKSYLFNKQQVPPGG